MGIWAGEKQLDIIIVGLYIDRGDWLAIPDAGLISV
jgi:hypothetical protein